jgi:hypothetical protein
MSGKAATRRALLLLLIAVAGCQRCSERPTVPKTDPAKQAELRAGAPAASSCLNPHEQAASCEDTDVPFPGAPAVVRLCRLHPHEVPGEPAEGLTRAELLMGGKSVGCGKLEDVGSLGSICNGPEESQCLARVAADNLARTERFWAPKASKERLVVFFGDVVNSELPSIEIVRLQGGRAQTVFHSEPGRTERELVFSRLEDVDGDGVPELLGWERQAELDECQPYIPLAIYKLRDSGFERDDKLMEQWAQRNGKKWLGPEPNDDVQECGDEDEPEGAPVVSSPTSDGK